MDNNNKIILDLCGGTGAWSRPYREAGYDVRVITLPEYDVRSYMPPDNVYGILAAPPCTEFSLAKGNRPRDFETALSVVDACQKIIWQCRKFGQLQFWAMENPRGFLRQFLGIPHFTFEQWQYGGNKRKATDIWGYFKEPSPTINEMPSGLTKQDCKIRVHAADWAKLDCPPEYTDYINRFRGDDKRAALRAITPPGFAEAFYRANK